MIEGLCLASDPGFDTSRERDRSLREEKKIEKYESWTRSRKIDASVSEHRFECRSTCFLLSSQRQERAPSTGYDCCSRNSYRALTVASGPLCSQPSPMTPSALTDLARVSSSAHPANPLFLSRPKDSCNSRRRCARVPTSQASIEILAQAFLNLASSLLLPWASRPHRYCRRPKEDGPREVKQSKKKHSAGASVPTSRTKYQ